MTDVLAARRVVGRYFSPTPLLHHPVLDQLVGARVCVKLESSLPLGAFKIRGGVNLLASLDPERRARGIVSATRGNHGQSLAYACGLYGAPCTLFVPEGNNPDKNAAMRALGADVRIHGHDFDAAWAAAQGWADRAGGVLVHPGGEPRLVCGVATLALELVEQASEPLDWLFVPVGAGSCMIGAGVVFRALSPRTRLVGVVPASAPASYHVFHEGSSQACPVQPTLADGLAVRRPADLAAAHMRQLVDDVVMVSEEGLAEAIRAYLATVHQLAEGAGAAALAGAIRCRERIRGARVGVILSGANIDGATLGRVLAAGRPPGAADAAA
jgi:threonine dehydratase